jgi:RIO kinase 1
MSRSERLATLIEQGVIDEVVRPLLAGKEAEVYLVICGGEARVAKVYKTAENRSFKHRSVYTEGRRGRNSRRERAMQKRSKYGRAEVEEAWRSAEVDAIYRLKAAGVTVPEPYDYVDGVLVMELVAAEDGGPAPRLVDLSFEAEEAQELFDQLLREVVRMLLAGLVHGDLSDFNVLLGADGPVLIDFPQVVDAAANRQARNILVRDVNNLQQFLGRWSPGLKTRRYGEEMWDLYERGKLEEDTKLTGKFKGSNRQANTGRVLDEIRAAERDAMRRLGVDVPDLVEEDEDQADRPPPRKTKVKGKGKARREAQARKAEEATKPRPPKPPPKPRPLPRPLPTPAPALPADGAPPKRRRRRRRRRGPSEGAAGPPATAAARPKPPPKTASKPKPKAADPFGDLDALLSIED